LLSTLFAIPVFAEDHRFLVRGAAPFIGHATFNLKQDFRQQDSDAIAMIFREDVAKNALYRVQNSLSTPNGG
jgi:hypothetical protein